MAIRDWPSDERPREKLLEKGAAALSDAELLAILLRTGRPGRSALNLARDILKSFDSLRKLIATDRARFCAEPGLGPARIKTKASRAWRRSTTGCTRNLPSAKSSRTPRSARRSSTRKNGGRNWPRFCVCKGRPSPTTRANEP
jgi:DNA repair protein RadC